MKRKKRSRDRKMRGFYSSTGNPPTCSKASVLGATPQGVRPTVWKCRSTRAAAVSLFWSQGGTVTGPGAGGSNKTEKNQKKKKKQKKGKEKKKNNRTKKKKKKKKDSSNKKWATEQAATKSGQAFTKQFWNNLLVDFGSKMV